MTKLEGAVAGLQTVPDANGNLQMRIRGASSITGSVTPLVVVDGFPVEADLNTININDIDNVVILKDAAAASIWGVKAGNGVVVITTKKGKKSEKMNVDVSYSLTVDTKPDFSDLKLMNASDFIDLQLETFQKGRAPSGSGVYRSSKLQEIYYQTSQDRGSTDYNTIVTDPNFIAETNKLRRYDAYKQYEEELLRNSQKHQANIALSGGSEKMTFYGSLGYQNNKYVEIGNSNDVFQINLKNTFKLNQKLSVYTSANISYNQANNNGVGFNDLLNTNPYDQLRDENGEIIRYYKHVNKWTAESLDQSQYPRLLIFIN